MAELTLESLAERVAALEQEVAILKHVNSDPPGTLGDEQSDDPEAVARWVAAFEAIPPLTMSAEEEAAWRAARESQKQVDAARFDGFAAGLSGAAE